MSNGDRLLRYAIRLFGRSLSLRFVFIGVINTAFSYSIFAMLLFLGAGIEIGSLLTLMAGIFFSFHTQGTIVFRHKSFAAFIRFVLAWAAIYVANLLFIHLLMGLGANSYLAVAIAMGPTVVISFFIQKLAVFRRPATATMPDGKAP